MPKSLARVSYTQTGTEGVVKDGGVKPEMGSLRSQL